MAVKKVAKDVMQRDMVKLSYTDYNGRTAMVVQYSPGYSVEKLRENRQSEEPIYVAFESEQPQELSAVLNELRQYRTNTRTRTDELSNEVQELADRLDNLLERVAALERGKKQKWWGRK